MRMLHCALDRWMPFKGRQTAISAQSQCYDDKRACLKKLLGSFELDFLQLGQCLFDSNRHTHKHKHTQDRVQLALTKHHHDNKVPVNGDRNQFFSTPLLADDHQIPVKSLEFAFLNHCDAVSICFWSVGVGKCQTLKPRGNTPSRKFWHHMTPDLRNLSAVTSGSGTKLW